MVNEPVLLDTSGWIALLNSREASHLEANRLWREMGRNKRVVFITDWIVAETGNGLARGIGRDLFVSSLRVFLSSPNIRTIHVGDQLLSQALDLYQSREDKGWGLVDCASFILMEQQGIQEALTLDHHFDQAGFRRLIR